MNIYLFDMDGVLLESQGYHRALQETVRRMALALGFGDASMSPNDIAAFEAGGITSEWDEAAIVTAALLEAAWKDDPALNLPDTLSGQTLPASAQHTWPDILAVTRALSTPEMLPLHPLERAARYFWGEKAQTPAHKQILKDLILGARFWEVSLTHRTFQELVLGSEEFSRVYRYPPEFNCESYLLQYDRSNFPDGLAAKTLRERISLPGNAVAIITSRPSLPPAGVFSTPEAELGARLVGLEGIPILGWGGMCWLGLQTHTDPQSFLKPSPVHALAGMRMALGERQEAALMEAADLVENGLAGNGWDALGGATVSVFEDTPGGILSLGMAKQMLQKLGIPINTNYVGIAKEPVKVASLEACYAQVHASLTGALAAAFPG